MALDLETRDATPEVQREPRTLRRALEDLPFDEPAPAQRKPPEEREIVHRRTYADRPQSTYEAISDLIDDDELFHLFVHVRTGEDVVVHRLDEQVRVGLLHPRASPLADETDDVILAEPSRYSSALTLAQARAPSTSPSTPTTTTAIPISPSPSIASAS